MRNKLQKKAQITWFIIAGIIILLGVVTFIYIRQTAEKGITEGVPAGREVRYEGEQQIRSFVDSCLKPVVLQGLELQRLQGGYIEIPAGRDSLTIKDKEGKEQVKLIENSIKVVIDENGQGNDAPFWVTQYGLAIPSKEFMESELSYYVTKELDKCVGDFKEFKDMGFSIEKGAITTNVSFAKSIWVNVNLPLTVTIHEITYEISDFNIEIPINMELVYNIASDLALYEDLYSYLESFTLDLIEKYSWRGGTKEQPHYLPPKRFTDAGFDCSQTTWNLNEVKNGLKNNYNANFKYLKIAGTNFQKEVRDNPSEQGVFDGYIQNLFAEQYPTIEAEYVYDPDWFFNLDILPKSGTTLKPDRTTSVGIPLMPRLCTFKYRFNYFYDFPVLLKVKDDKSAKIDVASNTFEKEAGYEMQIPLWVYVCGNKKRECTGRAATYEINSTLQETAFCEDSQKLSGDIKINVKDGVNPLEGVDIYYLGASPIQNCFIGRTNSEGAFTGKFPFCEGCSVDLYKQGYPSKKQRFDVLDYKNKEITFNMMPFVNLTVNAKLIHIPTFVRSWHETNKFRDIEKMIKLAEEYGYDISSLNPSLSELIKNKALMIKLTGETDLNYARDTAIITGKGPEQFYYIYPDPENAKLSLGQGTYDTNVITTANIPYIKNVPVQDDVPILDGKPIFTSNQWSYLLSKIKSEEGTNMSIPLGPDISYTWDINNLKDKKTVIFYVLSEYLSDEVDDWSQLTDNIMQNETMKAELFYQGTPIFDSDGDLVNCINHRFIKANGRVSKDATPGYCWNRINVNITKEEYLPYIMPELI